MEIKPLTKTTRTDTYTKRIETGFWLPVHASSLQGESKGESTLQIWMEEGDKDDEGQTEYFCGAITLGAVSIHINAYRIEDRENEWHLNDDQADQFLGDTCDHRPQNLTIEGYAGEWTFVASPFS